MADHSVTEVEGKDIYRMISVDEAAFTIGLRLPNCRMLYEEDRRRDGHHVVELHDPDSTSWAQVEVDLSREDGFDVFQFGSRRLWDEAVAGYHWWQHHGQPDVSRFGMTITSGSQVVSLKSTDGMNQWTVG